MVCQGSQIMRCSKCQAMFCVPAIVGKASVWHSVCDAELELLMPGAGSESVQRAQVFFVRGRNRLEVSLRAERE